MNASEVFAVFGVFAVAFVLAFIAGLAGEKESETTGGIAFFVVFGVALGIGFSLI